MNGNRLVVLVSLAVLSAAGARAGEVQIGWDTLLGGTKIGTCHVTSFRGPADAVKAYESTQKDRFEPVDPAVVEKMKTGITVRASIVTNKQPTCARDSGIPEKVVFTEKGANDPVLVIPLDRDEVQLKNMMGAEFTGAEGHGTVALADIEKMVGKEYDFHLVYSDHKFRDKWKKDYAAKLLKER